MSMNWVLSRKETGLSNGHEIWHPLNPTMPMRSMSLTVPDTERRARTSREGGRDRPDTATRELGGGCMANLKPRRNGCTCIMEC